MQGAGKLGRVRWRTGSQVRGLINVKVLVSTDPVDWEANMRHWEVVGNLGNGFRGADVCMAADGLSALKAGELKRFDQGQAGSWHTVTFTPVQGATGVMFQWSACDARARFSMDEVQLWSLPIADLSTSALICGSSVSRTITSSGRRGEHTCKCRCRLCKDSRGSIGYSARGRYSLD